MAEKGTRATSIGSRVTSTAQRLESIEARLQRIEALLSKLEPVVDGALPALATAMDALDERVTAAGDGLRLSERGEQALALVERVSRPATLAALTDAVDLAEQVPAVAATLADSVDELTARLGETMQLYDRTQRLAGLVEFATRPEMLDQYTTLLEGLNMLAPAIEAANAAPTGQLGVFGLWRAMGDPDVQRAIHGMVAVARGVGKRMEGHRRLAARSKEES